MCTSPAHLSTRSSREATSATSKKNTISRIGLERNLASVTVDGSAEGFDRERFQRYLRTLREHEGWAAALREDIGTGLADFLQRHNLIELEPDGVDDLVSKIAEVSTDAAVLTAEVSAHDPELVSARSQLTSTSEARRVAIPFAVSGSRELIGLRSARARLRDHLYIGGEAVE